MADYHAELENMLVMTQSWLARIERNKYTTSVLVDIEELEVKAAMLMSLLTAPPEENPECTIVDNLDTKFDIVAGLYLELKKVADNLLSPQRGLKRIASDAIGSPVTEVEGSGVSSDLPRPAPSSEQTDVVRGHGEDGEASDEFETCSQLGKP